MTIINTHDQLVAAVEAGIIPKRRAVTIGRALAPGRGVRYWGWDVYSPYFNTDPTAAWYQYGQKLFLSDPDQNAALDAAMTWAMKRYGVTAWKRNRMGDWVPIEVQKALPIPKRVE